MPDPVTSFERTDATASAFAAALTGAPAAASGASCAAGPAAALRGTLAQLLAAFPGFALDDPGSGLLDVKVMAAIETSAPHLACFRDSVDAVAAHADGDALVDPLVEFFAAALAFKRSAGPHGPVCHLWTDGYRYLLREWFLVAVTLLLRHRRFAAAGALLGRRFCGDGARDGRGERFVAFDAHVKTLDEFRARRLRVPRVSLSADLLRQRLDDGPTPLDDLMQADFLLCLRSLLDADDVLARWYPRLLVFGHARSRTGFPLLTAAADVAHFGPLAALLGVADLADLIARFEAAEAAFGLQRWALGGVPLDFRGFLGWRHAA